MLKQAEPHKSAKWIPPEPWNRNKDFAERMVYDCPYCEAQRPKTKLQKEEMLDEMHIEGCKWVKRKNNPKKYRECERPGCPEILPKEMMHQTEDSEWFCAADWEWRVGR